MIYSYKEVLQKYGSRYNIKKALKNKEIYKLDKDIYSEKSLINPFNILEYFNSLENVEI